MVRGGRVGVYCREEVGSVCLGWIYCYSSCLFEGCRRGWGRVLRILVFFDGGGVLMLCILFVKVLRYGSWFIRVGLEK